MPTVLTQNWNTDLGSPDGSTGASRVTTNPAEGSGCLQLTAAADVGYWLKNLPSAKSITISNFYIRFSTFPGLTNAKIFTVQEFAGWDGVYFDSSTRAFKAGIGGVFGAPAPVTLALNQWYRVDCRVDVSTTVFAVDVVINGYAISSVSSSGGTISTSPDVRFGNFDAADTWTGFFDALSVSQTYSDFPLGDSVPASLGLRARGRVRGG